MQSKTSFGLLAEFPSAKAIYHACEAVRDRGYTKWDAYTPFPVHNLDKAMGLGPSKLPWIVLVMGLSGAGLGMLLQWWVAAVEYPLVIGAKPLFSMPAFVPVSFEMGILFGAFGAVFGMFGLNRLPTYHHPLFNSERFTKVTNDGFFIAIEATDPRYDAEATKELLLRIGASHVEMVQDE
jgi:hypothetical protein